MLRYLGVAAMAALIGATTDHLIAPQFQRPAQQVKYDEDIVFPIKVFHGAKEFVAAKGTLSGDWTAYKNNGYAFFCDPKECIVASVNQIGPEQISSLDLQTYPIKRWTDAAEIVAETDDVCVRITITLDRKTETVLWVETPINQTAIGCGLADNNLHKATLETSLYWRRQSDGSGKQLGIR
jgi:hypothetical protein